MKIIQSREYSDSKGVLKNDEKSKFISLPLLETDILFLQDLFLKNGMHSIRVKNFKNAQQITVSILNSLSYHKSIAYISESCLLEGGFDVLGFAKKNNLQDLFTDGFYFDFLYIEKSSLMANQAWFKQFEQYLKSYNFDSFLPIVQVEV